ncbi:MAG TPA: protein kinase [Candidatus Sulfotelmatobacter sp.]|nr:protein kinase [Candidatus Sulfotelmatobacter sp.]
MTEHPSDPDARAVLQESEPFQALRDKLVDQVFARTRERRYESGEVLIHQGVQGDALLVLVDGTVRVVLHDDTGRELMLARSKRGAVVGEMSLITQGPATADVVAETPVRALVLTASDFNELASRNPELTIVLTNLVADRLGRDLVDGLGGKTLSGYRIERCLGRGGMAVVYEATELETGERVALKMMSHRLVYQPGAFSRFEREARIVEPLAHPNIARLRGHFPAFRTEFIVMEFCDGATLSELLHRFGAFPEREAKRLLGQLASAIEFVHAHDVLHLDIKPGNVMLTHRGEVKLMDFGLAKEDQRVSDETATEMGTVQGTPLYMAPEQIAGDPAGPTADVYAFACLAFELVSGRKLFEGHTTRQLIQEKLLKDLPAAGAIGPGISADLHALLSAALEKDPAARLTSLRACLAWEGPLDPDFLERIFR